MGGQRKASKLAFWNIFYGIIRKNHFPVTRQHSAGQLIRPFSDPSPPVLEL